MDPRIKSKGDIREVIGADTFPFCHCRAWPGNPFRPSHAASTTDHCRRMSANADGGQARAWQV